MSIKLCVPMPQRNISWAFKIIVYFSLYTSSLIIDLQYIYDVYIHTFMNTVACLIFSVNRVTNQNIQIITKRNCYSNCCYYHVWVRMCVENAWKEWFHNGWVVVDVTDLSSQNEFADIQRLFLLPCFTYM